MSVDQAGVETTGGESRTSTGPSPRTLALVAGALALVLVAAVVIAVVYTFKRQHAVSMSSSDRRTEAAVVATADQFVMRMDNFDGAKFGAYIKRVDAMLTAKGKAQNQHVLAPLRKAYAQLKLTSSGHVVLSGISASGAGTATVLVMHDQTIHSTQGTVTHLYRWSIALDKVSGRWLVDNFQVVR